MFTNYNSIGGNLNQNTNAKKEEIVGKFVNLTRATEVNLFTIIAVAQAIRDIGGVSGSRIRVFDHSVDEILATQKLIVTLKKSTTGGGYLQDYKIRIYKSG